jgi:hypothetical protein
LFTDEDASLLTYKHSDGYPDEVIPLLRGFWQWYPRTNRLEYLTATWFYYCKRHREGKFKNVDWVDAPMATDELNHNHPIALSYGICADGQVHSDTEHFYEVDIEAETVTHYTPESWGFEGVDTPAEIIGREPDETYRLTRSSTGNEPDEANNPSDSSIASDGGIETCAEQSQQVRCSNCGRTRDVTHTAEAGTTVGDYLGLVDSFTADVCTRCWERIPETIAESDNFGLLELEEWERKITTSDSRFVSATWQSEGHTIMLDAVGDDDWTVSWFSENEASGETDDWYSQYEVRQFAIDQIQKMRRLIDSGMVSVSGSVANGDQRREETMESSASDCGRCGSTERTNWVVQPGSPAGRYLDLSDGETAELCDACMREVAESIGNDDENARNESTQGGENE